MPTPKTPPKSLTLELPLAPAYGDEMATLAQQTVTVNLDLSGGPRTFQGEAKTIGAYGGAEVKAQLSFGYEYDPQENKLTIRGNDDRTDEQLRITTFLSSALDRGLGQPPSLVFHTMPNDIGQNEPRLNVWADHVARRPAFLGALAEVARSANDTLVKAAMDAGVDQVLELGTPPLVTLENLNDFKRMFGEPVARGAAADPISEVIRMQFRVNSTYVGTVTWSLNATFANVIGSTDDPKVDGLSWITLWADKCNGGSGTDTCSSHNYYSVNSDWKCQTSDFVGGHVITGTTAKSMSKGSTVYIFPICKRHNGSDPNYMKSLYNPKGVQLKYWET
jgi:hypothetical protein